MSGSNIERKIFIKKELRPDVHKQIKIELVDIEALLNETLLRGLQGNEEVSLKINQSGTFPKEYLENPDLFPKTWIEANGGDDPKKDGCEKDDKGDKKDDDDLIVHKFTPDGDQGSRLKEGLEIDGQGLINTLILQGKIKIVQEFLNMSKPIM